MFYKIFFFVSVVFGSVLAQSEPTLTDAVNSLPPELQGKVDESQLNDLKNKSEALFAEKCEKNGGPDAFSNAQKALTVYQDCLKGLVNTTVLQQEVEEANPNGQVDEVFKKYCDKTPQFKDCFHNLAEAAKPCFNPEERENLKTVYNVTEQLAGFICYKDGDRIALFISEGGPECLQEKQEQIQTCVNTTLGGDVQFNTNNLSANMLPKLQFGPKQCNQLTELQVCVVKALETCAAPTSANIVESLFRFVRQATPCTKFDIVEKPNAATTFTVTTTTLIVTLLATMIA